MTSTEFEYTHGMPDYHWAVFTHRGAGHYSLSELFRTSEMKQFSDARSNRNLGSALDALFPESKIDNEDFGLPLP